MSNNMKGFIEAILSSASFGLIPLFTIPVLASGMSIPVAIIYRFAIGCAIMLAILIYKKEDLRMKFGDTMRITFLSLLYVVSAIALFKGYSYMPSGIATTLLFSYPVWTAIFMMLFFHERPTLFTFIAIILAVGGVCFLSFTEGFGGSVSIKGVLIELFAGLSLGIYMVTFPAMRISRISSIKVTFYVFLYAMLMLMLYNIFSEGRILQPITSGKVLLNLFLLGLLPTAISNITLIMALKKIGSTLCAVLGAFEPLTAMAVGIIVLGEPLTIPATIGVVLILVSVTILILQKHTPKIS